MDLTLHKPTKPLSGTIHLPGSKSISNRVLIIKALSGLQFIIDNLSDSDDTKHLVEALQNCTSSSTINVGHAGTDMRFLTAFLSLQNGSFELTGSERLQQRPVKDLVEALLQLGADISYKNKTGYPPLLIQGKQLNGGKITINGSVSSQFTTALLLVAPYFKNGLELTIEGEMVSKPYVQMTVELMKEFGADITWTKNTITVKPVLYTYNKPNYVIESDWSAASYFYSMIALSPVNTSLHLKGLFEKSLQADAISSVLYNYFGVETVYRENDIVITKKTSDINRKLFTYDFIDCPDIAQTFVCTCIGLDTPFYFTGLKTLKVKETDRILALQNELKQFGCVTETTDHSIEWKTTETQKNEALFVSTYNDHRMAMSFAPLCLLHENMIIKNAEVVSKSYPLFWEHLKLIGITTR